MKITFVRECVARCLEASYEGTASIFPLPTVNDCLSTAPDDLNIAFVLYAIHHHRASDREVEQNMSKLLSAFPSAPIILLSEGEGADWNLAALRRGARGYIPTSATLDIAIGATQVVRAGGTFVPASSLGELAHLIGNESETVAGHSTARQMAVLAQGKSNGTIARELNLSESTVKAHVGNLMQKLNAANRTQIVYRTRALFTPDNSVENRGDQKRAT